MRGVGATFGDLFVHRRCIEIRRELQRELHHYNEPQRIEELVAQMDELDAMRLSPERMEAYEAEHGRSSPIIFKARATIGRDFDQGAALRELRTELEDARDAAVSA